MMTNSQFSIFNFQKKRGFTLIETLIAISILSLAVAGPLFTASRAVRAADVARDQLIASYLAQEAVEYARAMRDNEYLAAYQAGGTSVSATAWANFVGGGGAASIAGCRATACTLDPTKNMGTGGGLALEPCSGSACKRLYLANGVYTVDSAIPGSTATPFVRTLRATTVSATDERLTATVSWTFHGVPYTVTVTDHLTSWQ